MKTLKEQLELELASNLVWHFSDEELEELAEILISANRNWIEQHKADIGNQVYSDHKVVAETVFDVLLTDLTESGKESR
jgi:UTP-glucose-1-phosphate uridylyltransferase